MIFKGEKLSFRSVILIATEVYFNQQQLVALLLFIGGVCFVRISDKLQTFLCVGMHVQIFIYIYTHTYIKIIYSDENHLLLCLVLFLRRCISHRIASNIMGRILLILRMKCMGLEYSVKLTQLPHIRRLQVAVTVRNRKRMEFHTAHLKYNIHSV